MSLLARYVQKNVLGAIVVVTGLFLALDLVFSFLGELEDLKGHYQAPQAFLYVAFHLTWRLCDLLPLSSLVGVLIGLGLLANQSELTVMRAAGVSVGRIVGWALSPAMILVVLSLLVAEYVVPVSIERADTLKFRALGQDYHVGELAGYWQREGNTLVRIQSVRPDGSLYGIYFYQLNEQRQVERVEMAEEGHYYKQGDQHYWQLQRISSTHLATDGTAQSANQATRIWQSSLTPDFLRQVTVEPDYLSLTGLYHYTQYLTHQGLQADSYLFAFWKKLLAPLVTLSMVIIGCCFIFGPLRSVTMGLRIVAGVLTGLGFHYLQDLCGYASLVYHFSPLLAAMLPIAICLVGGGVALRRVR